MAGTWRELVILVLATVVQEMHDTVTSALCEATTTELVILILAGSVQGMLESIMPVCDEATGPQAMQILINPKRSRFGFSAGM